MKKIRRVKGNERNERGVKGNEIEQRGSERNEKDQVEMRKMKRMKRG
jgi:hypothetical protein